MSAHDEKGAAMNKHVGSKDSGACGDPGVVCLHPDHARLAETEAKLAKAVRLLRVTMSYSWADLECESSTTYNDVESFLASLDAEARKP